MFLIKPVTRILEELVKCECAQLPPFAVVIDFGCSAKRYDTLGLNLVRCDKRREVNPDLLLDLEGVLPCVNESFELGFSFNVINYVEDKALFLSEVYRVLKPNAVFLCSGMTRTYDGVGSVTAGKLVRGLKDAGFKQVRIVSPFRSLFGGTCIVRGVKG